MTVPEPAQPKQRRSFFSRRFAPLVTTWIIALVAAGLIYWFEIEMPAFHEVVAPIYAIIAALAVFFTWRWIRTRHSQGDRRHADRRRTDRRDNAEQPTELPKS
jgi:ABC-type bacteriocin/lantibiotic exporter with double-glycine peptidase domain